MNPRRLGRTLIGSGMVLVLVLALAPLASAQWNDLHLKLSGSPRAVVVGQQVVYSATVTNGGSASLADAAFRDVVPGKASFVSASASQGSCSGSPVVVCDLGSLAGGASATVTVTVTANDAGLMIDQGSVSTSTNGPWRHEQVVITQVERAPIATPQTPTTQTTTTTETTTAPTTTTTQTTTTPDTTTTTSH